MSRPVYPAPTPGVPRITQSELNTFLVCGMRWLFEQESAHRRATVRMVVGTAVAAGAAADNRHKAQRGEGLPLSDIVERAVTGYEEEVEETEIPESTLEVAKGKDEAADAARVYGLKVSPLNEEVLYAEHAVVSPVGDFELAGTPDVVTSFGVGDGKVGRAWRQDEADRSSQLDAYGILHRAQLGAYPQRLWIDSVFESPKGWSAVRLYTHRKPEHYLAFVRMAESVLKAISAGVFLPASERAWQCSAAWCPHWRTCPIGQRRALA